MNLKEFVKHKKGKDKNAEFKIRSLNEKEITVIGITFYKKSTKRKEDCKYKWQNRRVREEEEKIGTRQETNPGLLPADSAVVAYLSPVSPSSPESYLMSLLLNCYRTVLELVIVSF